MSHSYKLPGKRINTKALYAYNTFTKKKLRKRVIVHGMVKKSRKRRT